jgi:hypothetical protein
VLGFDLEIGQLGPGVKKRLARAILYHKQSGARILIASTADPLGSAESAPVHKLMAEWLKEKNMLDFVQNEASKFTSLGEVDVLRGLSQPGQKLSIISSWWHLPRVWMIALV